MYAAISFVTELNVTRVEIISTAWLEEDEKSVYWPDCDPETDDAFEKLLHDHCPPFRDAGGHAWELLDCKIVHAPQGNTILFNFYVYILTLFLLSSQLRGYSQIAP